MSIKRKLFLAFLLLAFLPTSCLIWLSYYLATEGSKLVAAPGVAETLAAGDSLAMWALSREQNRFTEDLEQLVSQQATSDSLPGLDFLYDVKDSSLSANALFNSAQQARLKRELTAARSLSGRLLLEDRLLIWQSLKLQGRDVIAGKFVSSEYFHLANRLLEGRTRFQSLSHTLLPGGQELLLNIAIALTVISLILSLLAAQMLSHTMASPLGRLVDATQRISRGDLSHRIPAGAQDEVGTLVDNFNRMTENLEQTTKNLLAAEREMAWKETARTIAHEIKNLLTPVNVTLFRIRKQLGEATDPELQKSVDALSSEIEAVAEIAREFSLFAHPTRLARTDVNLADIIGSAVALHTIDDKTHKVEVSIPPEIKTISADPDLLRRALSNLIKNAIEATPYGGRIEIKVERRDKKLELTVHDDGPGADEAIDLALPYITTKKSGTGLGLAIVKKVCEAHHWSLSYGNANPGFTVTIGMPTTDGS